MLNRIKTAVLVGSHSKTSFNQKIARYLQQHAPDNLALEIIDISGLPIYDRDMDELPEQPEGYTRLRQSIGQAQAVIFVTPEHNAAIPAVLKNAIDICTRPAGQNLWAGKPAGIVTAAAAMAGGQRVGDQLRAVCISLNMPALHEQVPLSQLHQAFDENGNLTAAPVIRRLQGFISAYSAFVARFVSPGQTGE